MMQNNIALPFPKIISFINNQIRDTCYRFDIEADHKSYYLSKVSPVGEDFVKNPFGVCVTKFDMEGHVFLIDNTDDTLQTPETLGLLNYISDCIVDYNNL